MDSTNSASNQTSTSADDDDEEDDVHSRAHHHHLSPFQTFHPSAASIASSSSIFDALSPYFTPFPFPPPPEAAALLSLDAASWNSPATAAAAADLSPPPPQPPFSVPPPAPSQPPPRGPRKRARASRRAPTTVINTETSNFRAMVQQFTGFPTPPFAAAPPFPARPRLDLFGAVPPFLLRPSPCSSSSSSSSSLFDHTIARSHLAATIGATNPIPPKHNDLSLFECNMQRPGDAALLQPPQPQMHHPPPHSAAMIPPTRWHVEDHQLTKPATDP